MEYLPAAGSRLRKCARSHSVRSYEWLWRSVSDTESFTDILARRADSTNKRSPYLSVRRTSQQGHLARRQSTTTVRDFSSHFASVDLTTDSSPSSWPSCAALIAKENGAALCIVRRRLGGAVIAACVSANDADWRVRRGAAPASLDLLPDRESYAIPTLQCPELLTISPRCDLAASLSHPFLPHRR